MRRTFRVTAFREEYSPRGAEFPEIGEFFIKNSVLGVLRGAIFESCFTRKPEDPFFSGF